MGDVWATVGEADQATQSMLADAMERRAEDPVFTGLRKSYFDWLPPLPGATIVEMGCGPGDVLADLATHVGSAEAIGIDPSDVMIDRAQSRHATHAGLRFQVGDARAPELPSGAIDLVLFHTTLCHIPDPDKVLSETWRVLRPGGRLVIFDGDYATTTAALGPNDPVDLVIQNAMDELVHDPFFCRTLPPRLRAAGFTIERDGLLPYLARRDAYFFMSLFDRGAVFLKEKGLADAASLAAIRAEAEARTDEDRFFGFTSFHATLARKPGESS